jgi:hypothetical protein
MDMSQYESQMFKVQKIYGSGVNGSLLLQIR